MITVVGALEFENLTATGCRPRRSHGVGGRFGTSRRKSDTLCAGNNRHQMLGKLYTLFVKCSEKMKSALGLFFYSVDDRWKGMP